MKMGERSHCEGTQFEAREKGLQQDTSLCRVLDKSVTFQGFPVTLRELCSEDSTPSFTQEDIMRLNEEEDIFVGEKVTNVYQKTMTYVPRPLYAQHFLREECLYNLKEELFVILIAQNTENVYSNSANSSPDEMEFHLKESMENIHSAMDEEEAQQIFAALCCSSPERNIHMLKVYKNVCPFSSILWLQTHGSIRELKKFVFPYLEYNEIKIEPKSFAVIAAHPGMERTTLLSHIAEEVKEKHRDWWVLTISLRDIADKFLKMIPDVSITHFYKFLSEIFLEGETSLSKILFQHSLEETGKFVLLLDGYDEIASKEEREKVLLVVRKLKEHSRGQVIITTRLHFKEELEEATSTFAYRLEQLNETEQGKLLEEIWIKNLDVSSDEEKTERVYVDAQEFVMAIIKKVILFCEEDFDSQSSHESEEAFEHLVRLECELQPRKNIANFTPSELSVMLNSLFRLPKDFISMQKAEVRNLVLVATDSKMEKSKWLRHVMVDSRYFMSPSILDKTVIFQGFPVTLRELCNNKFVHSCTGEDITRLIKEENISMGEKVTSAYETTSTYVPRTLYSQHIFRKECLYNLKEEELIVLLIPENVENRSGNKINSAQNDENEIQHKSIAVIAAETGMGKTTLLYHIAEKVKEKHRDWWVLTVSLRDIADKFLNMNPDVSITHFYKFLSEIFLEGQTSLSKILFQHSLEETGKFILLLDGYDEIASKEERKKVLLVLQKLKDHSCGQVIITTRLHFMKELEKATSTFAYRLKPLDETEQEKLLAGIWIKNLDDSSDKEMSERVHLYAREVVRHFSTRVDRRIGSLIGIPLPVTLLTEVCGERCNLFCHQQDNPSVELPFTILLSLYSKFENIRYEKLIKINPCLTLDTVCEQHRMVCAKIALDALFPKNKFRLDCCLGENESKPELDDHQILQIGILEKSEGENMFFIHKSFAAYFFAMYIAKSITKKKPCKKCMNILKFIFYTYHQRNELIRMFVDNSLAKSGIHIAALSNDVHALKEELEKGADINKRDALGRTACHLAVAYGHKNASEFLMSRKCDLDAREYVANFTPSSLGTYFRLSQYLLDSGSC